MEKWKAGKEVVPLTMYQLPGVVLADVLPTNQNLTPGSCHGTGTSQIGTAAVEGGVAVYRC